MHARRRAVRGNSSVAGRRRWWQPRSVTTLVLAGFLVVTLPLTAGLLIASHLVARLGTESSETVTWAVALTRQTHRLIEALDAMERTARQFHVLRDDEARARFLAAAAAFWQRAEDLSGYTQNQDMRNRIMQLAESGEQIRRVVVRLGPGEGWPIRLTREFSELRAAAGDILAQGQRRVTEDVEAMNERARNAQQGLLLQLVIILAAATAMALLFTLLITRPIRRLDQGIRSLADPDAPAPAIPRGPRDLQALGERLGWVRHRLQHADRERTRLLRQVSHELKTPLSALREGVSLLREGLLGPLTSRQREVAEILASSSAELQRRIEDLLRYNRLQSGRQAMRIDHIVLRALVETVLARHALSCESRGLSVELEVPDDLKVEADQDMLQTIMDNLVSNAVKYAAPGGRIAVSARQVDGGVVLQVADNGPGVPESDRARLFEPFFRGRAPSGGQLPGSGLGLAISRELARGHGGDLRLATAGAGGWSTVFELFLPMKTR